MTEEIKKKIIDTAKYRYNELVTTSDNGQKKQRQYQSRFIEGAEYGYSLASEQLTAAEARISDLQAELLFERSALELKNKRIKELEEGLRNFVKELKRLGYFGDPLLIANQLLTK